MVTIVPGPFTREGKEAAVQKEVRENYDIYFEKAAKTRLWFPEKLKERDEMEKYGHMITDDTKEILFGFMGVESIVDDYVFGGIKAAGNSLTTAQLYIQWGYEESRHGKTFQTSLIDSGLATKEETDKFIAETQEYHWTFEEQTGYQATPLLASAYAIFQERQTRWNYTQTRVKIWEEYGSPRAKDGSRIYPAISGAIGFPERDEGAHEANFTNIVRIYMKYFPDQALDALAKVSNHYKMPVVQLPNAEEFIRCTLAAGLGNPRTVINDVMNPCLNRMGLESRKALKTAITNFNLLPEDAIVHVEGKPLEGVVPDETSEVYTMLSSGEFVLDEKPQDS